MNDIDRIKSQLTIFSVVGDFVRLQNKGGRYWGLCPFHKEKTPSFTLDDRKGLYKCFGCGESGDIFSFIMKMQSLDFPGALKILAEKAGVQLTTRSQLNKKSSEGNVLYIITQEAVKWYQSQLKKNRQAIEYALNRGIDDDLRAQLFLGYAPAGGLVSFLKGMGYKIADIIASGLAVSRQGDVRDFFRYRLIFPIFDTDGRPVAFGGRVLKHDGVPKYLNSPSTAIFDKSKLLYQQHALPSVPAGQRKMCLVVEGYMDAALVKKCYVCDVVATLGTSMTTHHLLALWKRGFTPTICFDADTAGQRAMRKIAMIALPHISETFTMHFYRLHINQDPADFVKYKGDLRNVIDATEKLEDFLWADLRKEYHTTSLEDRSNIKEAFRGLCGQIQNNVTKHRYREYFNDAWYQFCNAKNNSCKDCNAKNALCKVCRAARKGFGATSTKKLETHGGDSDEIIDGIMACIAYHPALIEDISELLIHIERTQRTELMHKVIDHLLDAVHQGLDIDTEKVYKQYSPTYWHDVIEGLGKYEDYKDYEEDKVLELVSNCVGMLELLLK